MSFVGKISRVPATGEVPEIRQACEVANEINLTQEKLDRYNYEIMYNYVRSMNVFGIYGTIIKRRSRKGGIRKRHRDKRTMKVLDNAVTSKLTRLSLEEIQQLREEMEAIETIGGSGS
jgi:hypothetical protein